MTNNVVAVIRARLNLPDTEAFIHAFAPMISPGGMFVRTRRLKEVGATIRFEFSLANGERLLLGEGVVRQVRDGSEGPAGMLVKFTKLNRASKNLVDRVVAHKRAQNATEASAPAPAPVTPAAAQRPIASAPLEEVLPLTLPGEAGLAEDEALEDRDDPPSAGRIVSPGRVLSALRQQMDEEHEAQPPGVQLNEPAGSGESQGFSFGLDESEVDDVLGNLFGSMDSDEGPSLGAFESGALREPSAVGVVNHATPAEEPGEAAPARRRHAQVPFSDTLHAYPVPVETAQSGDAAPAAMTGAVALSAPEAVEPGAEAVAAEPEVAAEHDEAMMSASDDEFEGDGAAEVAGAEVESPEQGDSAADHTMTWRSGDIHKAVEGRLRVDEDGGLQALDDDEGADDISSVTYGEAAAASQEERVEPEAVPFEEVEAQDDDDIMAVDIDLSDFDGDARGETSDDAAVALADEPGGRLVDEPEPDDVTDPFASGLLTEQEGVALDDVERGGLAQVEEAGAEPSEALQIDPGELSEPAFPNEYMDAQPSPVQPEASDEVAQASFTGGDEAAASMASDEAPLMEDDDAQSHDDEATAAEDVDPGEDSPVALSAEGAESDVAADVLEGDGEAIEGGEHVEDSETVAFDGVDGEDEDVAFEDADLEGGGEAIEDDLADVFADDGEDAADEFEDGGEAVESPEFVASGGAEGDVRGEGEEVAFEDAADDFDADDESAEDVAVDVFADDDEDAADDFEGDAQDDAGHALGGDAQADDEGERSSLDEVSIDVEAPLSGQSDEASPLEDDDGIAPFTDGEDDEDEGAFDSGGAQLISTMGDGAVSGLGRSSEASSALIESVSALQALDLPPEESAPAPRPVPAPTASRELGSLLDEIHGRAGQKPASASDLLSGLNLATQPGKGLETLSEEPSELEDEGTPSFEGLLSAVRKEIDARDQEEDEEQADDGDALLDQVLKDSTRIAPPRPANFDIPTPAESDLLGNKKRKRGFFSRFFGGDE